MDLITGRILVVDDDQLIRSTIRSALEAYGCDVIEAGSVREAGVATATSRPDVMILDLGLPDGQGIDLVRSVREWWDHPIIVVTARHEEMTRLEVFEAGVDDYVTKPFSMPELFARVRVALRRSLPAQARTILDDGVIRIDAKAKRIQKNGVDIHLTQTEWAILLQLIANPGALVTQTQLLRAIWGPGSVEQTQYLRVYMSTIRKKLEPEAGSQRYIVTETGIGYRFVLNIR